MQLCNVSINDGWHVQSWPVDYHGAEKLLSPGGIVAVVKECREVIEPRIPVSCRSESIECNAIC